MILLQQIFELYASVYQVSALWRCNFLCSGATSVVKEVTQKGTKQNFAMKVIQKNVSCLKLFNTVLNM